MWPIFMTLSSLHGLVLRSNLFLYNGVYWVHLLLSICDVIVSQNRTVESKSSISLGGCYKFYLLSSVFGHNIIFGQIHFELILSHDQSHYGKYRRRIRFQNVSERYKGTLRLRKKNSLSALNVGEVGGIG